VIGGIVRERKTPTEHEIRGFAEPRVEPQDLSRFVDLVNREFSRLNDGNIARYRIRLSDYWSWFRATGQARLVN
jgi:hypothetical protein